MPLSSTEHSLKLNAEAVAAGAQTDLDKLGIAKNAREEQMRARKAAKEMTPEEKRHHGRSVWGSRYGAGQPAGPPCMRG